MPFERFDLLADGGLRQVEFFGGSGEREKSCRRLENPQLVQRGKGVEGCHSFIISSAYPM
jgi:hypothetical protein